MLTDYINAAMRRATYEKIEDGTYWGEISELDGVWADEGTLEACRDELQSVVEDWLLVSLVNGYPIPPLGGITLAATKVG